MSLQIEENEAKRLYDDVPPWFQKQLIKEFGQDVFIKQDFENIKTFDDACRKCGTTEEEFNEKWNSLGLPSDTLTYEKIKIVVKAINNGWTPDWDNTNQPKYYPWFNLSSGFAFGATYYYCTDTDAGCGSRLCFESREKSDYAGQQFLELYKEFITITE